jgi:hypothetical protein
MTKQVVELRGGFAPAPVPPGWELNQVPAGLPLVETIEPEKGPWSRAGAFGRLEKFTVPDAAGVVTAVFSNDHIEGPPRARVINLFRSDIELTHGANSNFYARITYGIGGVQNQFFCDWLAGGQLSLVATTLRVEAVTYAPNAEVAYSRESGQVVLGAMLGVFGSLQSGQAPITFTTQEVDLAASEVGTFLIPDFARRVIPQLDLGSNAYSDCQLNLVGGNSFATRFHGANFTAELARQGVTLPGPTTRVVFKNAGASGLSVAMQFQLGL